jgi:hypothetical protein
MLQNVFYVSGSFCFVQEIAIHYQILAMVGCDDWFEVLNLFVGVVDRCLGVDW